MANYWLKLLKISLQHEAGSHELASGTIHPTEFVAERKLAQ